MKQTEPVIHSDPEIMGGTPVFIGTRVPLATLLDYLEAGQPLSDFLEDFPTVTREQAVAAWSRPRRRFSTVRVLLDECLPKRLKRELVGHETRTAPETGWASKRNGELLALAVGLFDAFITADRNLSYQQHLSSFDIAIVVLVARSNRFDDVRPLVPRVLEVLP
jgi:uncharacterized protein (DUF433 family)